MSRPYLVTLFLVLASPWLIGLLAAPLESHDDLTRAHKLAPIFHEANNDDDGESLSPVTPGILEDVREWVFRDLGPYELMNLFDVAARVDVSAVLMHDYNRAHDDLLIEKRPVASNGVSLEKYKLISAQIKMNSAVEPYTAYEPDADERKRKVIMLGSNWQPGESLGANINNYAPDNFSDDEIVRLFEMSDKVRQQLANDAATGEGTLTLAEQRAINERVFGAYLEAMAGISIPADCQHSAGDDECRICLERLHLEPAFELPCTHRYHVDCAVSWAKRIQSKIETHKMRLVILILTALAGVSQIARAENELIFAKTLDGRTIPVEFEPSYTVERLKKKIKEKEGLPLEQQKLIFGGQLLKDDNRLQEYGLVAGSIITLYINPRGDDTQRIIVEDPLADRTTTVLFMPNMTVANLKSVWMGLTMDRFDESVSKFKYFFSGDKLLALDDKLLSDYNVRAWSVLTATVRDGTRTLLVKIPGRPTIPVRVEMNETVADIKDKISVIEGIPRAQQRIIFSDKKREHDSDSLDDLYTDFWPIVTLEFRPTQYVSVRTLSSKIMTFEVGLNDKVSDLKALIADKTRVPSHLQQLVFGGKLLPDDEKRIPDYDIAAWSTLTLIVRPRDNPTERVIIKTLTNRTIIVDIDLRNSIAILKDKIKQKTRVPPCLQQLVFEHKLLEDDNQLSDYGIKNGSTVYMVLYLLGAEPWT